MMERAKPLPVRVTRSEFMVLAGVSRSKRNTEIAADLGVAPSTVKTQLESMFARNDIKRGRTELVARALRDGAVIVHAGRAISAGDLREVILATEGGPANPS